LTQTDILVCRCSPYKFVLVSRLILVEGGYGDMLGRGEIFDCFCLAFPKISPEATLLISWFYPSDLMQESYNGAAVDGSRLEPRSPRWFSCVTLSGIIRLRRLPWLIISFICIFSIKPRLEVRHAIRVSDTVADSVLKTPAFSSVFLFLRAPAA
jgi:hypothetical protein